MRSGVASLSCVVVALTGCGWAASSTTSDPTADIVIYGDANLTIWNVDANMSQGEVDDAETQFPGFPEAVHFDPRTGLILQYTRVDKQFEVSRLLDLSGHELHKSKEWITAGKNVASSQVFGVGRFVTVGDGSAATVWSSKNYKALCSCNLNETITSASFDNSGKRLLTVSKSGVAVWDSKDCGLLFNIADRGNYSASKLLDVVGFAGPDNIAMLHTNAWIEEEDLGWGSFGYAYHWTAADLTFHDASTGEELYTVSAPALDPDVAHPTFSYYSDFDGKDLDGFTLRVSPTGSNVAIAYDAPLKWKGRVAQIFDSKGELLTDFAEVEESWSMWRMVGFDSAGAQVLLDMRNGTIDPFWLATSTCPCFAAAYDVASGLQTHSFKYEDIAVYSNFDMHFLHNGTRIIADSGCASRGPPGASWQVSPCMHVWDLATGTELVTIEASWLRAFGTVNFTEQVTLAFV